MKVDRVIVAEPEFIKTLPDYDFWVKTSATSTSGMKKQPAGFWLRSQQHEHFSSK